MLERLTSMIALPKNIAGDLSLILLFVGVSLLIGFIFGRWKLVNILINVYISVALVGVMPEIWFAVSVYAKAGVFIALLTALTMFDERLFDIHITSAGTDFFWRFFVTSFLVTGSVLSSIFSFLPRSVTLSLVTPDLYFYIASPWALLFWLVVPILALFLVNTRLR
ncbi:MAG: hypothetical protein WAT81_05025 [Candidatus Moraniibacteriota bacterium]